MTTAPLDLSDEHCRHRLLTNGPCGSWRSMPGTHDQLFNDAIRFDPEGTGEMQVRSLMFGDATTRFLWRMAGYGVIARQDIEEAPAPEDGGQPDDSGWYRVAFVIHQRTSDVGTFWVLQGKDEDGFWPLTSPVVPAG
jgi:hypothetical protein